MIDRVGEFIESHGLWSPGEVLVVGVSGGPDSLALLDIVRRLQSPGSSAVHVAHLNHMIRGERAAEEAEYVRHWASEWELPFHSGAVDVPAYSERTGMSLEEAGRQARYAFLFSVGSVVGAAAVAVGHNADDQVETIAMHWIRGAALAGLRGMRPLTCLKPNLLQPGCPFVDCYSGAEYPLVVHEDPAEGRVFLAASPRLRLIRPLLGTFRADIESYCSEAGLKPLTDMSNLSPEFFRNRLRMELVPLLCGYNPRFKELALRSADALADDYDYLLGEVATLWQELAEVHGRFVRFPLDRLNALPVVSKRYLLREATRCLAGTARDIEWKHVAEMLDTMERRPVGSLVDMPQGLAMIKEYGSVAIGFGADLLEALRGAAGIPLLEIGEPVKVAAGGAICWGDREWVIQTEIHDLAPGQQYPLAQASRWEASFDYDLTGNDVVLRRRRPGDRFRPLGMSGAKSLQDFMTDSKIESWLRDYVPLLVAHGDIAWVVGWRVDDRFKVGAGTKRILHVSFRRTGDCGRD
ncbi:MAG: tRNA lysidine(34) synthetase TilS [Chloroflexi bacterium]|nr:tRNA lysidine(34) synthetase TilS [Chloroflexota bacterium]